MDKVQQHIQTVRAGLERRTQGELNIEGKELWVRRQQYGGENSHVWIGDIPNPDNMHLFANAPTWLLTSIELLEQQQREIDDLKHQNDEWADGIDELCNQIKRCDIRIADKDKEIKRLEKEMDNLRGIVEQFVLEALSPKEEEQTDG